MEQLQVQVEYGPGKVRKFNIPDKVCSLEELKCDIQSRIESLRGSFFGIQYLDDDQEDIFATTDSCILEAFRCATPVQGTSMRRMKLKTFHGSSPDPVEKTAQTKSSSTLQLQPKSLFNEYECADTNLKSISSNPIYKSPLQPMIDEV